MRAEENRAGGDDDAPRVRLPHGAGEAHRMGGCRTGQDTGLILWSMSGNVVCQYAPFT